MTRRRIPVDIPIDIPGDVDCTLDDGELSDRLDEWRALAAHLTSSTRTDDGVRLTFPVDSSIAARAAELATLEQGCCGGQLRFGLDIGPQSLALTVWGSAASALVDELDLQTISSATTSR